MSSVHVQCVFPPPFLSSHVCLQCLYTDTLNNVPMVSELGNSALNTAYKHNMTRVVSQLNIILSEPHHLAFYTTHKGEPWREKRTAAWELLWSKSTEAESQVLMLKGWWKPNLKQTPRFPLPSKMNERDHCSANMSQLKSSLPALHAQAAHRLRLEWNPQHNRKVKCNCKWKSYANSPPAGSLGLVKVQIQ